MRGDHHDDGQAVDEDDGDDVVEGPDVVIVADAGVLDVSQPRVVLMLLQAHLQTSVHVQRGPATGVRLYLLASLFHV